MISVKGMAEIILYRAGQCINGKDGDAVDTENDVKQINEKVILRKL